MILNDFKQWWQTTSCTQKEAAERAWDYQQKKLDRIEKHSVKTNGPFSLLSDPYLSDPYERDQRPNQQNGLDLYITVLNNDTGVVCNKKLYKNKKGLHFRHTGYSHNYLYEFTGYAVYIPFQIDTRIK